MIIEKNIIAAELKKLKNITPPKVADISGILFSDNMLIANNLQVAVTAKLDVETDEAFVIPTKAIDMIENLPAGEITITESNNRLTVKSEKGRSTFATIAVSDFPQTIIPDLTAAVTLFNYDAEQMSEAIGKVLYAVPENSAKQIMTGVLIKSNGKQIDIIGCDGFRAAWNQAIYTGEINAVIPKQSIVKLLSLDLNGSIEMFNMSQNRVIFRTDKYSLQTPILVGDYINLESTFDTSTYLTEITVERVELLESVKRALICSSGKGATKINITTVNEQKISVSLNESNTEFLEEIPLIGKVDEEIDISLNARFLIDALKASSEKNLTISYKSAVNALVLRDSVMQQLLLPLRK